jgi:hypothetical protein
MNIVLVVSHDCFFDASNSRIIANIEMVETSKTKNMQQLQAVSNERIYLKGIIFAYCFCFGALSETCSGPERD